MPDDLGNGRFAKCPVCKKAPKGIHPYDVYLHGMISRAVQGGLPFPAKLGPLLPQLPTPPYRPPAYVGLSLNPFASTPSPPPPSSPSPNNAPVFFPGLSLVYRHVSPITLLNPPLIPINLLNPPLFAADAAQFFFCLEGLAYHQCNKCNLTFLP